MFNYKKMKHKIFKIKIKSNNNVIKRVANYPKKVKFRYNPKKSLINKIKMNN